MCNLACQNIQYSSSCGKYNPSYLALDGLFPPSKQIIQPLKTSTNIGQGEYIIAVVVIVLLDSARIINYILQDINITKDGESNILFRRDG